MKIRIELDVEVDESKLEEMSQPQLEKFFHILMCDAFGEFAHGRCEGHEEEYVAKRYPEDNEGYSWLDRKEKVKQVKMRNGVASAVRRAVFNNLRIVRN